MLVLLILSKTHEALWAYQSAPQILAGTERLDWNGDIASDMVDGVDRFLLQELRASVDARMKLWNRDGHSEAGAAVELSTRIEPMQAQLRAAIGMVDERVAATGFQVQSPIASTEEGPRIATELLATETYRIYSVRWRVFEGVDGIGLMVVPTKICFSVVVIPDAGQVPSQLCGLGPESSSAAIELAHRGGLVIIPSVISRTEEARNGRSVLTDQEFLYRTSFVLGRHTLGYQVQEALSAVDNCIRLAPEKPVMIAGWGEGGWIALHAAAVDHRIHTALVSGHFGPREQVWMEPIHRNVHGLLRRFGDAQLAMLIAPNRLYVEGNPGPTVRIDGKGAAPSVLAGPLPSLAKSEVERAQQGLRAWKLEDRIVWIDGQPSGAVYGPSPQHLIDDVKRKGLPTLDRPPRAAGSKTDWSDPKSAADYRRETLSKWDRFQQRILDNVHLEREAYWSTLDTSSLDKLEASVRPFREAFRNEVIGDWEKELSAPNPRTRLIYEREKWLGYEVVLDVFDEIIAYGVLLVPRDIKPNEKRPCVVFQHGLEGRPADTIVGDHPAYHDVSAQLADQGYVVFAPQNLYLFQDRFRTLQRKSNPLGKTLFSTIIPQHQQLVRWLQSRPEVDGQRIAFYGLSYGGKSAMRIPALVPEYCLSICSADFNDWVWKNGSTSAPYSYVWTNEYEIFEFDLGRKFNYAEMATLIAPRPFMVERGHFDTVAPDERVGLEFAKVQRLYAAKLGSPERCRIEWFVGPHTIHGQGTFEFLRHHLGYPGAVTR